MASCIPGFAGPCPYCDAPEEPECSNEPELFDLYENMEYREMHDTRLENGTNNEITEYARYVKEQARRAVLRKQAELTAETIVRTHMVANGSIRQNAELQRRIATALFGFATGAAIQAIRGPDYD